MENGESGLHGGHALLHVEVVLKPELGLAPIQRQTLEVLHVWGQHQTNKFAPLRIAQFVSIIY